MLLPHLRFARGFASLLFLVFILECALSSLGSARRRNATGCSRFLRFLRPRARDARGLRGRRWCTRASFDATRRAPQTLLVPARRRAAKRTNARPQNSLKIGDACRRHAVARAGHLFFLLSSSGGTFFLSFLTNWDCPPALCSSADFCMFSSTSQCLNQACAPFWFETNTINSHLDFLFAGCVYIDNSDWIIYTAVKPVIFE